ILGISAAVHASAGAQDRVRTLDGYERAQRVAREAASAVRGGALAVEWAADSQSFEYERGGIRFRYDVEARRAVPVTDGSSRKAAAHDEGPERGRQAETAVSPDGSLKAFYRDRNVWLSNPAGGNEYAVTTDGNAATRVKYGTASWVYGEELSQRSAMWWSPDGRPLAYYRFDEHDVRDYYVVTDQRRLYPTLDTEAYPKSGTSNPVVDLFVYDVEARHAIRIDVRDGQPFDNTTIGHYVYRVAWTADGRELLFIRMNRRQNAMELVAAEAATGTTRVVLREAWPTGWVMSEPRLLFLADGRRFIWESQRNGWDNFYLYDLSGRLLNALTSSTAYEAASLVKVDERAGVVFYTARDGDSPLKLQLHRVALDGTGDRRLTDP